MAEHDDFLLSHEADLANLGVLLALMAEHHASDLFVSVGAPVKIKINGAQHVVSPRDVCDADITYLLQQNLDSFQLHQLEATKELQCALTVPGVGRFRLSVFRQRGSFAFVVRYVPSEIPRFEDLGLPAVLPELIMSKRGLILVVGPTGSGKTTTLASLIDLRNETSSDHILTVEDPIEFVFQHKNSVVNQREIGTDAVSYEEALKNAMRQAPDVIWIGEIRDQKTMDVAMQYAQSGHLCLATLHASNSYNALNRIVGFYPPSEREALFGDLGSSLKAIVSQRLIPSIEGFRAAAVEILVSNRGVADLIAKGAFSEIPAVMERNGSEGSQTFETALANLVKDGAITVEMALAFADSSRNLYLRLAALGLNEEAEQAGVAMDREGDLDATRERAEAGTVRGSRFATLRRPESDDSAPGFPSLNR